MTSSFNPQFSLQAFIPEFRNFDIPDDQRKLLHQNTYSAIATSLNLREVGNYETVEILNGQQFFEEDNAQRKRYGFRKAFVLPAIVAGGSTGPVAHNIVGITLVTDVSGGVVTDVPDFRGLPHASVTAASNIEVIVTATDYMVNVGAGSPDVVSGILVINYLKQ